MKMTILLSVLLMAGLFLMRWSGIALIRDKRFFTFVPKTVADAVQPRHERFPGAYGLGWLLVGLAECTMGGAVIWGGVYGVREGFTFVQLAARFLVMILLLKAFDVLIIDYFLLCRSHFFQRYYPETAPFIGPHLFGHNRRTHLSHFLLALPASALMAWLFPLILRG